MNAAIPENVERFFLKDVDSIAQWEGLLLLYAYPDTEWSIQAVARRLYVDEREIARLLAQLAERHMLVSIERQSDVLYRYRPASPELAQTIAQAADIYRQYLIPVTHLIHSKSASRIQEFADAFRIRRD